MRKIIRLIKKKVGREEKISPIIDEDIYVDLFSSSCGGTIKGKKIVVLTNSNIGIDIIQQKCCIEKSMCVIINLSKESIDKENINKLETHFWEADIVINMLNGKSQLFDKDNLYNSNDIIGTLYRIIQKESDYFINNNKIPVICSVVFVGHDTVEEAVIRAGIKSMLQGLGYILPNHGIVSNALLVSKDINLEDVMNMVIFLVSKYGYALTGEVLEMS